MNELENLLKKGLKTNAYYMWSPGGNVIRRPRCLSKMQKLEFHSMTKSQLIALIEFCNIGFCECCDRPAYLLPHHWNLDDTGIRDSRLVCHTCNTKLIPRNFYGCEAKVPSHILPDWDTQCAYIKGEVGYDDIGGWEPIPLISRGDNGT